jgi:hypothetical protein
MFVEAKMSVQTDELEIILARLDEIIKEAIAIRRALLATAEPVAQKGNFTERLLGCLGAEPIAAYDFSLDWQRFGA